MKNIASLLHRELHARAAERALSRYPAPELTIREQIAASQHNRVITRQHYVRKQGEYRDSCEDQAANMYVRIATLLEYNTLAIEIDNVLSYIFEIHRQGKKIPAAIRRNGFWKYYINLVKTQQDKQGKRDAARLAYLMTIDEMDHKAVTGVSWRRDAGDIISSESINAFGVYMTKLDREHFELVESRNDYGSMSTAYEKKWTDGSSRLARSK